MNNFVKTKEWFKLGFDEFDTAVRDYDSEDYDAAVYHIQQCVEKCVKAIICFIGVEVKKTHYPAKEIIKEGIIENPIETDRMKLNEQQLSFLKKIVDFSVFLEEQDTIPRYGFEQDGHIIAPSEIYTEKKTKELFSSAKLSLSAIYDFLSNFNTEELKETLKNLYDRITKLR